MVEFKDDTTLHHRPFPSALKRDIALVQSKLEGVPQPVKSSHSDQGQRGQGEGGDRPAEPLNPGWVGVVCILGRAVVDQGEHPDDRDQAWRHHFPSNLASGARHRAGHVRHVGCKTICAVAPHDRDGLKEGDVHQADCGRVVVDDVEPVDAALEDVRQAADHGEQADDQHQQLVRTLLLDPLPTVLDRGDDHLDSGELAVHPEHDDQGEEDDGPELRERHLCEGVGEDNKDKTRAICHDRLNLCTLLMCEVAKHGEDGHPAEERDESVDQGDDESVSQDRPLELVVAGKGDEGTEGDADRVKNLRRRVYPDLWLCDPLPVGSQEEQDAVDSSGETQPANSEGNEEEDGEGGCDVDHLPGQGYSLPEAEVDDDPGADQEAE